MASLKNHTSAKKQQLKSMFLIFLLRPMAYPGTVRSCNSPPIGTDSVQVLEHWVELIGAVWSEAEARVKCEVFAEIVDGEIANVELDPITPVFSDPGCVDQGHSHCSLNEDSVA